MHRRRYGYGTGSFWRTGHHPQGDADQRASHESSEGKDVPLGFHLEPGLLGASPHGGNGHPTAEPTGLQWHPGDRELSCGWSTRGLGHQARRRRHAQDRPASFSDESRRGTRDPKGGPPGHAAGEGGQVASVEQGYGVGGAHLSRGHEGGEQVSQCLSRRQQAAHGCRERHGPRPWPGSGSRPWSKRAPTS